MMKNYNSFKTYVHLAMALMISISVFGQNTPKTVSMNGTDNNSTAFSTEGTIATSITTFYTHWDATYLYIGWSEGRTNYSSDLYYVAIDTDPNTSSGASNAIEGVEFVSGNNLPDYYAVFENNSSFYGIPTSNGNAIEIYDGTSGTWNFVNRINGNDNTESKIDFQDAPNGEVRIRISWANLGFTPGDDKPLGLTYWTNNSNGDFMWSRFPNSNPATGATPKTLTHQIIFNSTGSGVNPSTSFYENSFSENTKYTSNDNGDWNDTNNWTYRGIPTNGGDVSINNSITLDIDASIDNATVNAGSVLTVNSGTTLTTANELSLESASNSYASLISDGTILGTVVYNRYVNNNASSGGNDLISAPVSGQLFNAFILNNPNILAEPDPGTRVLFGGYDRDANAYELWDETDTTPLEAGQGYRSGITPSASSNLVRFEGIVNSGIVQTLIDVGTLTPWNLIGNPYPSYMNAQAFLTASNTALLDPSATAIYGYNDGTGESSGGIYTILNYITASGYNLAPGQGFFVASNPTGGNIEFSPAMRRQTGDDDFILGRQGSPITNLKLELSSSTKSFYTDIYFTQFSTQGLDPGYDASLFGGSIPPFSLYSNLVMDNTDVPMAIQALGETDYNNVVVPLGVASNFGIKLTFTINTSDLPSNIDVYLDDVDENTSTLLNNSDYIITPGSPIAGTGRFFLRFTDNSLSTSEEQFETIQIYTTKYPKTLFIKGVLKNNTTLEIYDIQGRLILNSKLDARVVSNQIDISEYKVGVYVVKLKNGVQQKSQKVIIN